MLFFGCLLAKLIIQDDDEDIAASAARRLQAWFRRTPRRLNYRDAFTLEPHSFASPSPAWFLLHVRPQRCYVFQAHALQRYVASCARPANPFTNALLLAPELRRLRRAAGVSEGSAAAEDAAEVADDANDAESADVAFLAASQDFVQSITAALDCSATGSPEDDFYATLSMVFFAAQPLHRFPAADVSALFERQVFQLNRILVSGRWAEPHFVHVLKRTILSLAEDLGLRLNFRALRPRTISALLRAVA